MQNEITRPYRKSNGTFVFEKLIREFLIDRGFNPEYISPQFLASQGMSPSFPRRFFSYIQITPTCHIWMGSKDQCGYGQIGRGGAGGNLIGAHVAAWILHNGPIPEGFEVCHNCSPNKDNPACVAIKHLWLGPHDKNMLDAVKKRKERDGAFWRSKLSPDDVVYIRRAYANGGITQKELGRQFGVHEYTISSIVLKKVWKHLI